MSSFTIPSSHTRWMSFVDGENFTIRAQGVAAANGLDLDPGEYYLQDVFIWLPTLSPTDVITYQRRFGAYSHQTRSHYYTSLVGDEDSLAQCRESLWHLGFHPEVFKKPKRTQKSKGVDITLARDVLGHAFTNNYDVAFLFAGDADYVPLVAEVKRLGKIVGVCFFEEDGLSTELKLAGDVFFSVDKAFLDSWKHWKEHPNKRGAD